jgi:ATP-dependent RNA helicase DOB1
MLQRLMLSFFAWILIIEQRALEVARDDIKIEDEALVAEYYDIRQQIEAFKQDIRTIMHHPQNILRFLQSGRLIRVRDGDDDFGWGVIINYQKVSVQKVWLFYAC